MLAKRKGRTVNRQTSEPMSGVDAAWLRMDSSTNLMTITGMLRFDQGLQYDKFCRLLETKLLPVQRFRQRVVMSRWRRPRWELDPHFQLAAHVHRVGLPAPGDEQALQTLVGDLMSSQLDSTRPLWQMYFIDGPGQETTVLVRLHHCIADGFGLMFLVLSMADDASEIQLPVNHKMSQTLAQSSGLRSVLAKALGVPPDQASVRRLLSSVRSQSIKTVTTAGRLLTLPAEANTCLRGQLTVVKRAAWSSGLDLQEAKQTARVLGGTINDLMLAALAGGLRRYLQARGQASDELEIRGVIPVNLRPFDQRLKKLGNAFGLAFLDLPVGQCQPSTRMLELRRRTDELRGGTHALVTMAMLGTIGHLSAAAQKQLLRLFHGKCSAIITNVPGPTRPIHFAGGRASDLMFWVPQSLDVALGVSIFSYAGKVRVGVSTDANVIADPSELVAHLEAEYREMQRTAQRSVQADRAPADVTRPPSQPQHAPAPV